MIQQPIPQPRKRRGKCALIDPEQVRYLASEGMTRADIAELYDVSTNAIDGICRDFGIKIQRPTKYKIKAKPRLERPEEPAKPTPALSPQGAELRATGGRYADLRAWARKWGTTERKALQEWLKLRLPVSKGVAS